MSYTIYYSLGSITVSPNTVNTQTSIYLPGEDYTSYGQLVDQNLVNLVQNFANSTPPPRSIPGQTWFDTTENVLKITTNGGSAATWNRIDGSGLPGGANTAVQFNDAGTLGGDSNFTFNSTTDTLTVGGNIVSGNISTGNLSLSAGSGLTVSGTTDLGPIGNVTITGGTNGQLLTTDGSGVLTWTSPAAGYGNTQVSTYLSSGVDTAGYVTTGNVKAGNVNATGTVNSNAADLAERYRSDAAYEAGTVVEFGGEHEVTLATEYTTRVAGVVSTLPAYVMNMTCAGEHVVTLALQGRVPCRVTGTVHKGDMMVSAGNGLARSCDTPAIGTVIGKSLENFSGGTGTIEVVVGRL